MEVFIFEGVVIVLKLGISLLVHLLQELAPMHPIHLYALFVVVIYNAKVIHSLHRLDVNVV